MEAADSAVNPLRSAFRWIGSLAAGTAVVYCLSLAGLWAFGWFEDAAPERRATHVIDLLDEIERARIADELGLESRRAPRPAPPPPAPVRMPRQVSGFVQLEVEVGPRGEVVDAEVLGAVPEGYFEAEALESVRQNIYEPSPLGTYRRAEVVPFTVTVAPEPESDSAADPAPDSEG